jgi:hypothetical protein
MKVVCKNNSHNSIFDENEDELTILLNIIRMQGGKEHLIIDKTYEVLTIDKDIITGMEYIYIKTEAKYSDNDNIPYYYSGARFITIDEDRDNKLNYILK